MPGLKAGIYSWLSNVSGITDLVGSRIYPSVAPASAALPFITFQRIGFNEDVQLRDAGFLYSPIQVDIWGASSLETENVFEALNTEVQAQIAAAYANDLGSVNIRNLLITNALDGFEPPDEGKEIAVHRITVELDIWHEQ